MKSSTKKYRIKSKFRFITFLVIVIGFTFGMFGFATGMNFSTALENHSNDKQIEVCAGDTLWDIAGEFKSNDTDIREAVYDICRVNDIKDGSIQEGMILSIPQSL